jgi:filamentous hemagglutinin family protein
MRLRNLLLTSTALLAFGAAPAAAGPDGPVVVGGSATVSGAGSATTTINQTSNRAIINWNTFNIGTGETTTFVQPGSSSVVLNRVTGGLGPSQIYGTLTANGQVFVINRDGVLVGPSGVINTAGFLASTIDISNANFMAGRYNFDIAGRPDASIVNMGRITATSGGFAALVAPGVRNSGTITATLGTVALASGNTFTLDLYGDRLIQLSPSDQIANQVIDVATGRPLASLVTNGGRLSANGGRVELTAAAARAIVDSVINTSGVIEANSVGTRNGRIVLGAATAGSKGAGAPPQTVRVSGTISAAGKQKGTKGGSVVVTGENIQVTGATIDVSGDTGGGRVMLGGDWGGGNPALGLVSNQSAVLESYRIANATTLSVDATTTIDASAKSSGNGGKVILWSDSQTTFAGTIFARGGESGGNGGFVEVSGKHGLSFAGTVDTRAPNGLAGTLLLDPEDIVVGANGTMTVAALQSALAGGNVVLSTGTGTGNGYGDITIADAVSWSGSNSLTLNAYRNITINAGLTNTGGAAVTLRADSAGTGVGRVSFGSGAQISTAGAVSIFYNPTLPTCECGSKYENPHDYTSNVTGGATLTAYMLVNTFTDLQAIGTNTTTLGGTYALGRDINADNMAPIGSVGSPFTGLLDGQGRTISNAIIAPDTSGANNIGLFGAIGATGTVRNLTLDQFQVSANPNVTGPGQFVGGLAGQNAGTISNVNVTNSTVNGLNKAGVIAGGLVGQNGMFGQGNQQLAGSISNSSATGVTVTVGNGCNRDCGFNIAGGLVGSNAAGSTITGSHATGTVTGGAASFVGGLVGQNGVTIPQIEGPPIASIGTINSSYANVAATITGPFSAAAGGLVGSNAQGSTITNSQAFGAVTGTANDFSSAGGLVGLNSGTITSTTPPVLASVCAIGASFSCATGNVTGGAFGVSGGLVGGNQGTIEKSFATGAVTSGPGGPDNESGGNSAQAGGLAGSNQGTIRDSFATGNVGSVVEWLGAGGLVGENSGKIERSFATGNVVTGNNGTAGGLVASNIPSKCSECANPGTGADNSATILNSFATGNVTVGNASAAGGLVGANEGTITTTGTITHASGNVTGGNTSILGGFAGGNLGTISLAYATGSVTGGTNVVAGGFVGANGGSINQTYARGAVTGGNSSYLGGFVGANVTINVETRPGSITQSYALGPVTGSNEVVAAAFAALNRGTIDQTYATGLVTTGPGSTMGGLVAANNLNMPGFVTGVPPLLPVGTVTNSYWDRQTTGRENSAGGSALDTAVLAGAVPPGFDPTIWSHGSYPHLVNLGPQDTTPGPPVLPPLLSQPPSPPSQLLIVQSNPINPPPPPPDLINTQSINQQQQQQQQGQPAPQTADINNPVQLDVGAGRYFFLPPPEERRLVQDEVVIQLPCNTPQQTLNDALAQFTVINSQCLATSNVAIYRLRIGSGQTVADAIRALASNRIVVAGQANYLYSLGQDLGAERPHGDSGQYVLEKLKLGDILRRVRATNIPIAVIDSEIDAAHPDLEGAVVDRYDATGVEEKPHSHGTGMAGAIASHRRLLGTAPGARLLAIRAFSTQAASAQSTTFNILKGLDYAVSSGARIVNMSFAGPRDPTIERALKAAYDKGVVLIAAAGNAGPRSPPLFPAADKHVIAVTATDIDDQLFTGATRGNHIAVSAPGVDILVPAPEATYQMTTGTSVATAHVSGIVALLLERNPRLTPADVRRILTVSAKRLGPNEQFGAGLIDPAKALQLGAPRSVEAPAPARR